MTTDIKGVEFNTLTVAGVEPLTDDAVAITIAVPNHLVNAYRFVPGQHVAVRTRIAGQDVRRTYSICADAASDLLRIGVKRITDGLFSSFATAELRPGDQLDHPIEGQRLGRDPKCRRLAHCSPRQEPIRR